MNYEQAEKANVVLADVVESIATMIDDELNLPSLVESLQQRAQEVRDDRFTVLVVGEFKRGKSTLLNAMMGAVVLPQKVAPCTAVVTVIGYGEEKDVQIVFAAKQGEEPPPNEILSIEEFGKRFALKAEDAAEDSVFDGAGFDRFSTIQYARIRYPVELCRHRVELVDSPGLGEHQIRTQRTERFLDRADAIVMVLDATQLLREEELHFLDLSMATRTDPLLATKIDPLGRLVKRQFPSFCFSR